MTDYPSTRPAEAVETILKIAKQRGISFTEAANSELGKHILGLSERISKAADATIITGENDTPAYLQKAAQEIAYRDNISVEKAYARVGRERPDLAEMYRSRG